MRTDLRRRRPYRIFEGILEDRKPVSSLIPGISVVPVALTERVAPAGDDQAALPTSMPSPEEDWTRMAWASQAQPSGGPSPGPTASLSKAGHGVGDHVPLWAEARNIEDPTPTGGVPESFMPPEDRDLVQQPASSSRGIAAWPAIPMADISQGPSAWRTAQAPLPSKSAFDDGDIRPMTLLPASLPAQKTHGFSLLDNPSGSGGGPPQDKAPIIHASGGTWASTQKIVNGQPVEGQYVVPAGGPAIGSIPLIYVSSPVPNDPNYNITSITWSGGTPYSGYFSADPDTEPAWGAQELEQNVSNTSSYYTFIIDATPRTYTLNVTVGYQNNASGTSTVTFTSYAPTGNLTVSQLGNQSFSTTYMPDGVTPHATVWLNPGIHIQATSSTGPYTAGRFMFMQIIDSNFKKWTNASGTSQYIKNDITIPPSAAYPDGIDLNGPLLDDPPIAYPFSYNGASNYTSWVLGPNGTMPFAPAPGAPIPNPPEMVDTPAMSVPLSYQMLSQSEDFSTYLMYKPSTSGVWIALQKVSWSWSKTANRPPGGNWSATTGDTPQPNPTITTPTGAAAFPTWVNLATVFNNSNRGIGTNPPPNPPRPGP